MKYIFLGLLMFNTSVLKAQLKIGEPVPEISLPDKKDSIIHLSSYKGKVVLVDFWASWCKPCRAAHPSMVRLYKKYAGKGFEIFGVSIDNKKSAWLKAVQQDRILYTQVNDMTGWDSAIAGRYNVEEIPAGFLLDKDGKLAAVNLEGIKLENKIKQLLK